MFSFADFLIEGKFKGTVYHGSNARFDKFEASKARIINDFYGGGIAYFTDNKRIGVQYAKGMAKKGGDPKLYEVQLNLKKVFDVDDKFTGQLLVDLIKDDVEAFARGARLLKMGADKFAIIAKLKKGDIELTGDQVFRGLSKGQINTASTRELLKKHGYDGLRYNGGENMGMKKHNVYLAYHPESIKIVKRYKVPT